MNPVLPLSLLIPLLLAVLAAGCWMSWRSSDAAPMKLRKRLIVLRVLALLALAIFLINPGRWQSIQDHVSRVWVVMVDRSASMSVSEESETGDTIERIERAQQWQKQIAEAASQAGVTLRHYSYDSELQEVEPETRLTADGKASDLTHSADQLLTQLSAQGEPLAGVFVLTDGRQTQKPRHSNFALRAQALQVPFYALLVGGNQVSQDLALGLPRKTITAFPGQSVQLTAVLRAEGLGSIKTDLVLADAEGKPLQTVNLRMESGKSVIHTFSVKAPEKSEVYQLSIPEQEGELRLSNNRAQVRLRILDDKAKVFIAEGAPYWDSKFLAQLLRQQKHMDVVSVHRLSANRWFRVDSGESKPHESSVDVFPDTKEELMAYDLIIFGKNSEHFLTPQRIANLRAFVKDQGGAVLFSRSKPYTGSMPDLVALEPVTWKSGITGSFQMRPSPDGHAAGLFGQALPAPDSRVWDSLPALKDAHRIDTVKPFTRVLAYGELSHSTTRGQFPLLLVRRYGQGVSGLVNADGLWKWDFFPEARELGNMYQEFWIQMIHWMLSYSEFLPGQDFSLNTSASTVQPGTPLAIRMAYRGTQTPGQPRVEVSSASLPEPLVLAPAEIPTGDGRLKWGGSFTPEKPGHYHFRLLLDSVAATDGEESPAGKASLPETTVTVLPPPAEMDELSADQEFLHEFCASTGGQVSQVEDLAELLRKTLKPELEETVDQGVQWRSSWMHWISPVLVLLFLALEWWLRRRNGLV